MRKLLPRHLHVEASPGRLVHRARATVNTRVHVYTCRRAREDERRAWRGEESERRGREERSREEGEESSSPEPVEKHGAECAK